MKFKPALKRLYRHYAEVNKLLLPFFPRDYFDQQSKLYKRTLAILSESANRRSAEFIEKNLESALLHNWDWEIQEWCAREIRNKSSIEDLCLEFGVWYGRSINRLSSIASSQKWYGFDTFNGLPSDWYGTNLSAGSLTKSGKLPIVNRNVELVVGLFEDTLEKFLLNEINSRRAKIAFIHVDCDVYPSTKFLLEKILCDGTLYPEDGILVLFDEFFGYPGWEHGEYQAFTEVVSQLNLRVEYLGFSNQQAAIKVYRN